MEKDKNQYSLDRRRFLKASAGALGGLTLAGCAGLSSSGTGSSGGGNVSGTPIAGLENKDVEGKTNITVWFWDEGLKYAVQDYNKTNTKNVNVKFVKLSYADTHQKLITSMAAGSGAPDVCAIEIGQVGNFAGRSGLEDLTSESYGGEEFKDDMVAYKWTHGSTADGKLVAMPWDIGPSGLWYLQDVFKQAGLPTEPDEVEKRTRTWDDVFQLGVDLRKKLPKTALFADAFNDIYTAQVEQQGHGWFDGNKLLFEEKATKPLESAVQARKMGVDANIDWWGAEWHQGLKKQAFCGMMIACWMQTGLTQQDKQTVGKWRVVPPPEGHFNWGGSFLSIPSQGKNKPAAWDFVKYVCCSAQGQNTIFRSTGIFPAYKPAWKDPVYDQPVDFFGGQKTFRLWTELAENVPANVVSKYDVQAGTIISNEITKVEKNNKDPEQAMKDAETAALKQIKGITA